MSAPDSTSRLPVRRLVVYYGLLLAALAAVMSVTMIYGGREHPAKPIAGGYDVAQGGACMGAQVDLIQSGEFVNLGNAQGTLSGHLRLRGSRLSGSASCLTGKPAPLDAQARGLNLTGTVGGQPLNLIFRRQPPPPGALKPRVPGSLAGSYSITPSSRCLGGTLKLGAGSQPGLSGASKGVAGTLRYDSGSGSISGQVMCADGTRRTLSGQAADRPP